jgi:sortase A
MADRRANLSRALRVLEWLLLSVGVASIGWLAMAHMAAEREQASLSRELDRIADVAPPAAGTTPAIQGLVGRIDVPRLKLSALAREGADVGTLRRAVGHIPGTALPGAPGNAGFAAHRDTFFRPLQSVRNGDEVILTTTRGVYRYLVTGTRIVEPADVSVLDPTPEATLTLVTCYPFDYVGSAPQRFIVRAALQTASPARTPRAP